MASTLSYGFVKPATGDKGSVFWPALEDLIQQTNDHSHDGNDSALLSAKNSRAVTQSVSSGSWVDQGSGIYRQTVTLPASITALSGTVDDFHISLRDATTNEPSYNQIVKVSSTTFYVYTNDNTQSLKAVYT